MDTIEDDSKKKLSSVRLEGLFGTLTHLIPLNKEAGITILTGPNGCGKTTILELIYAFASVGSNVMAFRNLIDVPYRKLVFYFDDDTNVSVIRRDSAKMLLRRNASGGERRNIVQSISMKPLPPSVKEREKLFKNECELQFAMRRSDGRNIKPPYTTAVFDPNLDEEEYRKVLSDEWILAPSWLKDGEFLIDYTTYLIPADRLKVPLTPQPAQMEKQTQLVHIGPDGEEIKQYANLELEARWVEIYSVNAS